MEIPEDMEKWLGEHGGLERMIRMLPDDNVLKEKSRVYGALSDPIRLKILHLLSLHPLCVCLIKDAIGISDSKLSYHLSVLKQIGLIVGKRRKNWIIYSITDKGLECIKK